MGFTTGLTGGVTLTLSVAYLTVLGHQRNRQRQSDALRTNAAVLRALALADPVAAARLAGPAAALPAAAAASAAPDLAGAVPSDLSAAAAAQELYYPSRPTPAAAQPPRAAAFVDELKGRWNAEVEGAVRRVQTTDWAAVRESAEVALGRLWAQAFGGAGAAAPPAPLGVQQPAPATAASAPVDTKTTAAAAATAAAPAKKTTPPEVERALQQRYTKTGDDPRLKKSVSELLEERYAHKA